MTREEKIVKFSNDLLYVNRTVFNLRVRKRRVGLNPTLKEIFRTQKKRQRSLKNAIKALKGEN
jgi:hypothetical protein